MSNLPEKMKAIVAYAPGDYRFEMVDTPRAGEGEIYHQVIGNGTWIGGRSTICNNSSVGNGCVVAACACVVQDVPDNTLVGGVPAKVIRSLEV